MIANVPIAKPLLIVLLSGVKQLGKEEVVECTSGSFIFLSNRPNIDMRNIPGHGDYFAVLIEFDFEDFESIPMSNAASETYIQGEVTPLFRLSLSQFMTFSKTAPDSSIKLRKKELLHILYESGHHGLSNLVNTSTFSERVYALVSQDLQIHWSAEKVAMALFTSKSTLGRRLKEEGTSLIELKNRARLGQGLHLIQSTTLSIGAIAQECGFHSQSRFSDQFKQLFGMTPRELRKTKMTE